MKLQHRKNGRIIKVGSTVNYCGESCTVYKIESENNIGLESKKTGSSWDMVRAHDIECFVVGKKLTLPKNCKITRLSAGKFALEYSEFCFEPTVPKLNEIRIMLSDFMSETFLSRDKNEPTVYVRNGDVTIGYMIKGRRFELEKKFGIQIADRE